MFVCRVQFLVEFRNGFRRIRRFIVSHVPSSACDFRERSYILFVRGNTFVPVEILSGGGFFFPPGISTHGFDRVVHSTPPAVDRVLDIKNIRRRRTEDEFKSLLAERLGFAEPTRRRGTYYRNVSVDSPEGNREKKPRETPFYGVSIQVAVFIRPNSNSKRTRAVVTCFQISIEWYLIRFLNRNSKRNDSKKYLKNVSLKKIYIKVRLIYNRKRIAERVVSINERTDAAQTRV